jgi:hypothetical protein
MASLHAVSTRPEGTYAQPEKKEMNCCEILAILAGVGMLIAGTTIWAKASVGDASQVLKGQILLGSGAGLMFVGSTAHKHRNNEIQDKAAFAFAMLAMVGAAAAWAGIAQWAHGATPESMLQGQILFLVGAVSGTALAALQKSIRARAPLERAALFITIASLLAAVIPSAIVWGVLPSGSAMGEASKWIFTAGMSLGALGACVACSAICVAMAQREQRGQ